MSEKINEIQNKIILMNERIYNQFNLILKYDYQKNHNLKDFGYIYDSEDEKNGEMYQGQLGSDLINKGNQNNLTET